MLNRCIFYSATIASLALSTVIGAFAQEAKPFATIPTIHASGRASVTIAPDVFSLILSVRSDGQTPEAALDALAPKIDKLLAAVKAAGIAEAETQSPGPGSEAVIRHYYDDKGHELFEKREITGYRGSYSLTITSNKMEKPGMIIPAAGAAGAVVDGISFDISDRLERLQALELLAVKDAALRARQMIEAAGEKPGRVLEIDPPEMGNDQADLNKAYSNPGKTRDFTYAIRPGQMKLEEVHQITMEILPR